MVPLGGPEGAGAADFQLAIVGMSAEGDDAELAVVGRNGWRGRLRFGRCLGAARQRFAAQPAGEEAHEHEKKTRKESAFVRHGGSRGKGMSFSGLAEKARG